MARIEHRFIDRGGNPHATAEAAAVADASRLVLGTKAGSGVVSSIATLVIEKRGEIELIYAELDSNLLETASAEVVRLGKARVAR